MSPSPEDQSLRHRNQARSSDPQTDSQSAQQPEQKPTEPATTKQPWLLLALSSGAFAAFNGAFAKLTTTSLTSSLTNLLLSLLSLPPSSTSSHALDLTIRGLFFTLNILSNGVMWALFTRALTAHTSATQVSILNTSANFLVTAVLGVLVFGERLPGLWWVGAMFLVGGNVIIGRKGEDQGETQGKKEL